MLERYHLAIIQEVNKHGSLTAAADCLCLTQSALSHAIKKLEQQAGTPLWLREGRQLRLTQAGEYLLGCANRLLPQFRMAEAHIAQYAAGGRGALRIGMECHPCYRWLLKVVSPYLSRWPDVDVDVKQRFQFGGIDALVGDEIDLLVTPDPVYKSGLHFEAVFDYEQVLVLARGHALAKAVWVQPAQLSQEILITYPVAKERLDIYRRFLTPAGIEPARHKPIEDTDIMLQMVEHGRGVAALPRWLAEEYAEKMEISVLRLGMHGISKQIYLGVRETDVEVGYLKSFVELAREVSWHISHE